MAQVDVDRIHRAREAVKTELATGLRDDLLAVHAPCRDAGPYDIEPASIGRRTLRNLALGYLMQTPDAEVAELCLGQYRTAHNMTDRMAALALIADSELPERAPVLADFRAHWQHDPLVMDKWFTVQATARHAETLARVRALLADPAFRSATPTRCGR